MRGCCPTWRNGRRLGAALRQVHREPAQETLPARPPAITDPIDHRAVHDLAVQRMNAVLGGGRDEREGAHDIGAGENLA